MLFPLPLTPFEYYFWCDDNDEYPATFPIELSFRGRIDRAAFQAAVEKTVGRHPMLAALIDDTGRWPTWVENDGQPPHVDWADSSTPINDPHGPRIDLTRQPGLRIWVRQNEATTRICFQVHHACCDGLAVQTFVEDLLVSYCQQIGAVTEHARLRSLDSQLLRKRSGSSVPRCGWGRGHACQLVVQTLRTGWEWLRILGRRPEPLAAGPPTTSGGGARSPGTNPAPSRDPGDLHDLFGFVTHALDAQQTRRLKHVATAHGVTSNDLLVRDLFRALEGWNKSSTGHDRGWLRINMPANERGPADRCMPAANRLSFTFLTRRTRDCRDRQALLRTIREETESIKRTRRGRFFLKGLDWASRFRGTIPWFLRRRRCFATICLSNVGRVLARTPLPRKNKRIVCGDAVLERIGGTPFVRPFTRAAITVIAYANELTINLRCDPRCFDMPQRQRFLRQYAATIEQTLRTGC